MSCTMMALCISSSKSALDLKRSPLLHPRSVPSPIWRGNCSHNSVGKLQHRPMATIGRTRGRFLPSHQFLIPSTVPCKAQKSGGGGGGGGGGGEIAEEDDVGRPMRRALQAALCAAEAAYILWLFLLPYAPGDPVWAIKLSTLNDLVGLSLNFFFVLPLLNSVGIHVIEAPTLHPMSEGLFNFVIAWTLLFAPLLFTDCQRDRFKGSLDLLWGFQMFLTNTFLIPYMAIRLNDQDVNHAPRERSQLGSLMTQGASIVGLTGGAVCVLSIFWAFLGLSDGGFGDFADRLEYLIRYLGSERLAYAFVWDIILYSIFQPWLIGDNLENVKKSNARIVSILRFIPVVGLVAYTLSLNDEKEP